MQHYFMLLVLSDEKQTIRKHIHILHVQTHVHIHI